MSVVFFFFMKFFFSSTQTLESWIKEVDKKNEPFSKLHGKAEQLPLNLVEGPFGAEFWGEVSDVDQDATGAIAAGLKMLVFRYKALKLNDDIDGCKEPPHRSLIDFVWNAALLIACSKDGEITDVSEKHDDAKWSNLRGPLDYAIKSLVKQKKFTTFTLEAKRHSELVTQGFNQLTWQMAALHKLANNGDGRGHIPICGATSDGIRYQFVVLGPTAFFKSELFGVNELKSSYSGGDVAEWIPFDQVVKVMALLMLGDVNFLCKKLYSERFREALDAESQSISNRDWSHKDFKEPFRGFSPLHIAARENKVELIGKLLNEHHPLFCRDSNGYTPLRWAAFRRNWDAFKQLLEAQKGEKKDSDFLHQASDGTDIRFILEDFEGKPFRRAFIEARDLPPIGVNLALKLRSVIALSHATNLEQYGVSLKIDGLEITDYSSAVRSGATLQDGECFDVEVLRKAADGVGGWSNLQKCHFEERTNFVDVFEKLAENENWDELFHMTHLFKEDEKEILRKPDSTKINKRQIGAWLLFKQENIINRAPPFKGNQSQYTNAFESARQILETKSNAK